MKPHKKCLQVKVKNLNEPKHTKPKGSEIKLIKTLDSEYPTISVMHLLTPLLQVCN